MIRPSKLQAVQESGCGLMAKLASEFPESSEAADHGTRVHREIAEMLSGREVEGATPDARAAVGWALANAPKAKPEVRLSLVRDGRAVTEGTADLVWLSDGTVNVLDWKTGRPENVVTAADNLQLAAYGLAALDVLGGSSLRVWLAFLDGDEVTTYHHDYTWPELAKAEREVMRVASIEPTARPGQHCLTCHQRSVCPSWGTREQFALAASGEPAAITNDNAGRIAIALDAAEERIEFLRKALKAHVKAGGRVERDGKVWVPSTVQGRESADLEAIRAAGATQFIKRGAPFERWGWRKAQ